MSVGGTFYARIITETILEIKRLSECVQNIRDCEPSLAALSVLTVRVILLRRDRSATPP